MSFCNKSASISLLDFPVDVMASKKYLRQKFKVELKFICAEFQIFSTLRKHDITVLVSTFHGNRSMTSYITAMMKAKHKSDLELTNYTTYPTLTGGMHNAAFKTDEILTLLQCSTTSHSVAQHWFNHWLVVDAKPMPEPTKCNYKLMGARKT